MVGLVPGVTCVHLLIREDLAASLKTIYLRNGELLLLISVVLGTTVGEGDRFSHTVVQETHDEWIDDHNVNGWIREVPKSSHHQWQPRELNHQIIQRLAVTGLSMAAR